MTLLFRTLFAAILLSAFTAVAAGHASAGDPQIDAAQQQGIIGETIDGYLGVVSGNVDPSLSRKVNEINNKRRALYEKLSKETGTTLKEVARITGEKQIAKAKRGEYYMDTSGSWKQK